MFNHVETVEIPTIKQINAPGGRKYETPTGKAYPSVTTVLGRLKAQAIQEWRNRVGEEEANKVMTKAARRGTNVHSMCEMYLKNDYQPMRYMPADVETFNTMRPYLNKINNIHLLEGRLYSDHLQLAGTVDCIAEYEGKLSVIDFKTSLKPKKREWIDNYFMQESAYAIMYEERTGRPITQLVTIIAVDDHEPQVFVEHRDTWAKPLLTAITDYMNSNT